MIKIEVEVSPEIVNKFGVEALRQRLQRTIELEELAILAQKIDKERKTAELEFMVPGIQVNFEKKEK